MRIKLAFLSLRNKFLMIPERQNTWTSLLGLAFRTSSIKNCLVEEHSWKMQSFCQWNYQIRSKSENSYRQKSRSSAGEKQQRLISEVTIISYETDLFGFITYRFYNFSQCIYQRKRFLFEKIYKINMIFGYVKAQMVFMIAVPVT